MKKRVVKLDRRQLRGLIREAIMSREPGSPLWSPPAEKKFGDEPGQVNQLPEMLADTVKGSWEDMFDEADPTVSGTRGKPAWDMQCEVAAEEFAHRVESLLEEIEQKLVGGEFYRD